MLLQKYLVPIVFLASIGISLSRSVAASSFQVNLPLLNSSSSHKTNLDQPHDNLSKQNSYSEKKIIFSQNAKDTQSTENQRNVDKETKQEERSLEREAKRTCIISYEPRNGKSKKCEPSIYEQAYPSVDFEAQDGKITDQLIRELQKDSRFQNRTIVK